MVVIGGADEAVVADVHQLPQIFDGGDDPVNVLLGGHACIGGLILDLLAVLIGAGQEHDFLALHPLEAGQRVAGHGGVTVADVQLVGGVINGGCDVECVVFAHGDDSSFLLWLCHKKLPVLPECTGQGRELNFRGTTLLRRALAGMHGHHALFQQITE